MKLIKPLTYLFTLTMSGIVFADVTVSVPSDVSVLVANGKKVELSGGFLAAEKTFTLPDGINQIVFRYSPLFTQGNDRISVESDAIIARFSATNTKLSFQLPEYRNIRIAEENINKMEWNLFDTSGNPIAVQQDKLIKPGMQIGRDYVRELDDYNRNGGIAAVADAGTIVKPRTLPAKLPEDMKADSTAEEMLHFWYQKADSATRARFKAYVNQQ